jgi:hypothetical protein
MSAVIGRGCLLILLVASVLVGCSSTPDKQWYKPSANYTVAEFKHDRDECTKDRQLDEECLKQRGWIPLTSDRSSEPAPKPSQGPRGPRY